MQGCEERRTLCDERAGVRIQNAGTSALQSDLDEVSLFIAQTKPRAKAQRVDPAVLQQVIQGHRVADPCQHDCSDLTGNLQLRGGRHAYGHRPCPDPERTTRRKTCGTRAARATRNHQHMAMVIFVPLLFLQIAQIKRGAGDGGWIRDFMPPAEV